MTLRELCKARKLNPGQAASEMGVEASVVYRWHRGDTVPQGDNLVKLLQWAHPHMTLAEALTKLPKDEPVSPSSGEPEAA